MVLLVWPGTGWFGSRMVATAASKGRPQVRDLLITNRFRGFSPLSPSVPLGLHPSHVSARRYWQNRGGGPSLLHYGMRQTMTGDSHRE